MSESEPLGTGSLVRRGALAAVVAGVANAVVVLAVTSVGVAPGFRPLAFSPVVLLTAPAWSS